MNAPKLFNWQPEEVHDVDPTSAIMSSVDYLVRR